MNDSAKNNIVGLIFSKDRAMQLAATIDSFLLHCRDSDNISLNVLYRTSSQLNDHQYGDLKKRFSDVTFIEETNFKEQVLAIINGFEQVLFLVDDNLFVKDFCLADVVRSLHDNHDAVGFSLRLGRNTDYCYPLSSRQTLPQFRQIGSGILKYYWPGQQHDFGYPLEVSSSVYRIRDILELLAQLEFSNPNTLEGQMAANSQLYSQARSSLLCYECSVTFCNPVNVVQNVYENKHGTVNNYTSEELGDCFSQGMVVDVEKYTGFIPNAAHQEAKLCFKKAGDNLVRISVIVPCYNHAHYLPEAVKSIVNQTYKHWECIIVNDGSSDNTAEVAKQLIAKYPDRNIRFIDKPNNSGLADTRNVGIEAATSEYILPLDADDLIHPEMLKKTVALLESHPEIAIAYTDLIHFGRENKIVHAREYDFTGLCRQNRLNYCSLYRREAWKAAGGYNPNMIWGYEDWELWISCGEKGYYAKRLPEPLFMYRVKENSMYIQARKHDKELKAQIILNHPSLYDKQTFEVAKSLLDRIARARKPLDQDRLVSVSQQRDEHHNVGDTPMVSVIVPTYNRPALLVKTLKSILNQTYQNFEIIVVNDAGVDVEDIIADLNERKNITYVVHASNRGLAAARNTGIKAARGKYIAYLDDDDIYYPDHLEKLCTFLESTDYKVGYTDAYRAHQKKVNGKYIVAERTMPYSFDVDHDQLLVRNLVPVLCVMHEKSCIEEVGQFDETLTTHEDWDLWIRMSKKFKFFHIKEVTAEVTWRTDGTTITSGKRADFLRTPEIIYSKYKEYTINKPHIIEHQKRRLQNLKQRYRQTFLRPVQDEILSAESKLQKLNFAIKTCTPSRHDQGWGDTHFANSLAKTFMKLGHNCEVHFRDEWNQPDTDVDIVIHIKGLFRYNPKPYNFNILWIISHPELHTTEEINQFDVVFCASNICSENLKNTVKIPCFYLPQATDEDFFKPLTNKLLKDIDVLFVGTNYYPKKRRKIIQDVLDTGKKYDLYVVGNSWHGLLDKQYYKAKHVEWHKLPELYSRAKIVLNDHHETMKQFGFINNRTFDIAALKVFQISDYVEGMEKLKIVTYQTPEDLREKLDYFLKNEKERERIAGLNYELCKSFTFTNAAGKILELAKQLSKSKRPKTGKYENSIEKSSQIVGKRGTCPKVSVIVSCYNCENFLPECLDSIRNQTMNDWELFLLDDASTDGTRSIIEKYAQINERIKPYYFQDNRGPYVRRNFAIERANSDFIVIQDADDIMYPLKLEILYNEIAKDERLEVVGSFYRMCLEQSKGLEYADKIELPIIHDEIMQQYSLERYVCWHGSAIIRKSMFDQIGLYDEHPYGSDKFWLAKAAEYSRYSNEVRFKNVPEYLTLKREHSSSQQGLLPTLDPRSRRAKFQTYWEYKLLKIREKLHNNPDVDIKAELRNCKCNDYIKRYGCLFEQWERQPLDNTILCHFISRGVRRFNEGKYVRCIIILDSVEKIINDITKRFKNYDLLRAMAHFKIDRKQQCLRYLNREIQNHNNPAAGKFLSDYFEKNLRVDVQNWCSQNSRHYNLQLVNLENESCQQRQNNNISEPYVSEQQSEQKGIRQSSCCKQSEPLVSVIMPAYNAAEHIAEAIESVLIQNYQNLELIVVNDGSTDDTKDIVFSFKDERIKYFYHENSGLAATHNTGIEKSEGSFLIKLDHDDLMTADFIAAHLAEFEKHPDVDLVYCDDCLIDENSKPIRVIERPEYTDRKLLIRDLFHCGFPVVPFRTCIRRSVFDKIGFFDEELLVGEDYDMMRRFVKHGLKIHHLKGAMYLRRMTSDSLSRNCSAQKAKSHFDVVKRFTDTFTYDELFPDIEWDKIAPQIRQLHAKCLTAGTYLAIGQEYVKTNAPECSRTAFDRACSELNDCVKMDPENQGLRQLLQKSKLIRARYTEAPQQLVSK